MTSPGPLESRAHRASFVAFAECETSWNRSQQDYPTGSCCRQRPEQMQQGEPEANIELESQQPVRTASVLTVRIKSTIYRSVCECRGAGCSNHPAPFFSRHHRDTFR